MGIVVVDIVVVDMDYSMVHYMNELQHTGDYMVQQKHHLELAVSMAMVLDMPFASIVEDSNMHNYNCQMEYHRENIMENQLLLFGCLLFDFD